MQITKELLTQDIAGLETQTQQLAQQFEQVKAALAQSAGALSVLKAMRDYIDKPEEDKTAISPENKEIQERDEARALSMSEVAELVAGPGATAEITPLHEMVQDAEEESLDANH